MALARVPKRLTAVIAASYKVFGDGGKPTSIQPATDPLWEPSSSKEVAIAVGQALNRLADDHQRGGTHKNLWPPIFEILINGWCGWLA